VKIFILNNKGYLSIRATQNKFFEGRLIGTGPESGVTTPDVKKISNAYGIKYFKLKNSKTLENDLKSVLDFKGPAICEVICPPNEPVVPGAASVKLPDGRMVSRPLEDMLPFLDREEYRANLLIKPVDE
jgi:acetolactate synthase-1/2/3 large subunit